MRIPITIVSGFLGSGKTTLINQILADPSIKKEEIIVIENEVGDINIDHALLIESVEEIYQLNQGCVCCNLRSDLLAILQKIKKLQIEEDWNLKHIIIETTGIADPRPIVQSINVMGGPYGFFYVDAVYSVVDTLNYLNTIKTYEEVEKQIVFADRIYLSKSKIMDEAEIIKQLKAINPFAQLEYFNLDQPFKATDFFNQTLFNRSDDVKPLTEEEIHALEHFEEHHHEHGHDYKHEHHHHHKIMTLYLTTDVPLSRHYFQIFINWLLMNQMENLYRYKGFFQLNDTENGFILQGVGEHYSIEPYAKPLENKTQLVLIGKSLNEKEIREGFDDLISYSRNENAEEEASNL